MGRKAGESIRPQGRQPKTSECARSAYDFIQAHPEGVTYRQLADHLGLPGTNRIHVLLVSLMYYPVYQDERHRLYPFVDGDEGDPEIGDPKIKLFG